jgi:hypothetical protein
MRATEREALEALRFDWAHVPDDVWRSSPFHVDDLHRDVLDSVAGGIREAGASHDGSPIGVAIQGQRGAGKTHLLGRVRQAVQHGGGYFFLVSLHDGGRFWESVVQSMLEGLWRETEGRERQLTAFLRRLAGRAGLLAGVEAAVVGGEALTPRDVNSLVGALRRLAPQVGLECQDTARALVLFGSVEFPLQDIGYQYLLSLAEAEAGDRARWGMHRRAKPPRLVVRDISRLLALTGPSVVAVDQIDTLLAQAVRRPADPEPPDPGSDALLLDQIADGLMSLREVTRRTLSVVACLPESWILIKERAVNTVPDRFREELQLHRIPDAEVGRALIEKRFLTRFQEVGFDPPHPTWPVAPEAFDDAAEFTPRGLLQRIDAHVRSCLRGGHVTELDALVNVEPVPAPRQPDPPAGDLAALDARFAELREGADVTGALEPQREDEEMPALLSAGLAAWIAERGDAGSEFSQDPPPSRKPAVHARLRRSLDEDTEDEQHWAFRAVASGNARAVQSRVRSACTMAGLGQGVRRRRLFLLRNASWPTGVVTREVLAAFGAAGGVTLAVTAGDLRTFAALRQLLSERDGNLPVWLATRQPASRCELFRAALGGAGQATSPRPEHPAQVQEPAGVPEGVSAIKVGRTVDTGQPVRVGMESLRKHTAIFAGSGSGKTVLIRRLVEECALRGVSAIVLDPNNDLARLGDPWPEPPERWEPGDEATAADYLAGTDVVVWTPRRDAGRPLSFQPLPDFNGVRDDADGYGAAIDAAVATLAPRAKVDGTTGKAALGQAVLRESLSYFARDGGSDLRAFIRLLSDLPDRVSALEQADRIAADMSQTLTAAMVNDPLFGGDGTPVDPGVLLTPPPGRRARVSVISLVGLPSDSQRQSFVNQLQMALFAWVKRHPAGDRPLGGLFVMDEAQTFAPSGAMTACTQSTLALASQARKYGLGLVFATQAPKGLHNRIPGNAATQFFGFLNSPTQIVAAREMARAKGSAVLDISRLETGQFYLAGEGVGFVKVRAPLCLSHHPRSPLTLEEVIQRARANTPSSPAPEGAGRP